MKKIIILFIFLNIFLNFNLFSQDKVEEIKNQLIDLNTQIDFLYKKCQGKNVYGCAVTLRVLNEIKQTTDTNPASASIYNLIVNSKKLQNDINNSTDMQDFVDKIKTIITYAVNNYALIFIDTSFKSDMEWRLENFEKYLNSKIKEFKDIYKAYCKKNTCYKNDGQIIFQDVLICRRNS